MAGILDKVEMTRRMCPVIFLVDTSGSMDGAPIGAVNSAIEGVLPELCAMNEENADAEINVAIMSFSAGADWVTGDKLVSPQSVAWNGLDAAGPTEMGIAFRELAKKLSVETGFMRRASGSVAPVLFLLSDGAPTDDYRGALSKLKENNWYRVAVRVAIGYGEADDNILAEFTGNRETVLHTNNPEDLKRMIRFVSITSSMVASRKVAAGTEETNMDDNTAVLAEELTAQGGEMTAASADEEW